MILNGFSNIINSNIAIIVTALSGSMVTCTTPSGVILTATENDKTWVFENLK